MCFEGHSCVFFEDAAQAWLICADTIASARRDNFKRVLVSDEWTIGKASVPDVSISPTGDLAMDEMPVSIANVIRRIREQTESTVADGFAGLLLLIDMSWVLRAPSAIAHHGEFEASLQRLIDGSQQLRAICLYHLPKFPEGMALDAMRTHPCVRTEDGECDNPHFLPPQVFLKGDAASKLDIWLGTLRPSGASKSASRREYGKRAVTKRARGTAASRADVCGKLEDGPQRWKVRCFGSLRIYRQDGTPVQWSAANGATIKTKTLFAYLLHCGEKGAGAEDLADLLWPQSPCMNQSLNRLYHTIHCLRIALGPDLKQSRDSPHVIGHNHHYHLALPEGTWVDVPIFEQFCRRGDKLLKDEQLDDALSCCLAAEKLYSGSLLSDIPAVYVQNVDRDWCWSRRYWLDEIYVKLLTQIGSIYRRCGKLDCAIAYAERALKLEPCFEPAHQELMYVFHQFGRRDAIERQYRMCMGALKRQEDRAPSGSTRVLFQRLMI